MTDIVERLREVAERPDCTYGAAMEKAADEIERLRADNQKAALEYLGQIGQLSDENTRLRADADFNYMHGYESAKSDYRDLLLESEAEADATIERLRAALEWAAVQFANHNLPSFSHQCRVYAEGE